MGVRHKVLDIKLANLKVNKLIEKKTGKSNAQKSMLGCLVEGIGGMYGSREWGFFGHPLSAKKGKKNI